MKVGRRWTRRSTRTSKGMTDALARIALEQINGAFTETRMTVKDPDCGQRRLIGSPADKVADFLLRVVVAQEDHIRAMWVAGKLAYDTERALSERLHATRRVLHFYKVAATAEAEHEYGTPDVESLPGLTLAMAISADSHPRAPGYDQIAPYTKMIMEDYS